MKVIMNDTGEVTNVAEGHARNYLLPKKLAVIATDAAIKEAERTQAEKKTKEQATQSELTEAAEKINGQTLSLKAQANEDGTLFGAVQESAIIDLLKEQGHVVEANWLSIAEPVKKTGKHEITVTFPNGASATFTLSVSNE
ncbi:MAG: 50S ribosomal protein L9 [Candidatus Kerfeldbacteria bacterium]